MAEHIKAALAVDENGNGVSDLLEKVLGSEAFGNGKDNWRNRRLLVVITAAVMLLVIVMVAVTWMIATLAGQKIDANNADMGSAMFWGAGATLGGALSAYLGVATWDHASQRRASIDAAGKIGLRAAQQNNPASGYPQPGYPPSYGPQNGPYIDPYASPYQPNTSSAAPSYQTTSSQTGQPANPSADPPGGF